MIVDPNFIQFLEERRNDLHIIAMAKHQALAQKQGKGDVEHLAQETQNVSRALGVVEGLAIAIGHAANWTGKQS